MRTCTKLALTGVMAFGVATSVTAEERLLARTERGLRAVSAALEVAGEPGLLSLQADTAQAVYREARRALNNSQFRDAARLFAQLRRDYPTSEYVGDAYYFEAFALYRGGRISGMERALDLLDTQADEQPDASHREDAPSLRGQNHGAVEVGRASGRGRG